MSDYDYNETVRLVLAQGEPKDLSLADAVRTVMSWPTKDRMMAAILRDDGSPIMESSEIEAIYQRSDFPISN
jgi:hypothetical protein